jgi:predicted nucleic acid-binding protein
MAPVTHLDSSILRGMVDPDDSEENRSRARRLFNSNPSAQFKVSILAVGEVVGKMAETRSASVGAEATAELSRLFRRRRLELHGIGKGIEATELATQMIKADPLLKPADALLVACAFADDECGVFATADEGLVESSIVGRQATLHGVRIHDARAPRQKRHASRLGNEANMILRQMDLAEQESP